MQIVIGVASSVGTPAERRPLPSLRNTPLAGYSFGCYTPDSWHVAPRYYGSGETFVFQLEVRHTRSVPHALPYSATITSSCHVSHKEGVFLPRAHSVALTAAGALRPPFTPPYCHV